MATPSSAIFRQDVNILGGLQAPVITSIQTSATNTLNSLNTQIATFNTEKAATQSDRDDIRTSISTLTADVDAKFLAADANFVSEIARIDGALAQETSDRLALGALVSTEVTRLDAQHVSDDQRLTSVETALTNIDTDLQNQITTQINAHNADIGNLDPRVAKYEGLLVIDEAAKTITIPADYKLVVQGAFEQGV